jgi:glucans biosynthesis protein C
MESSMVSTLLVAVHMRVVAMVTVSAAGACTLCKSITSHCRLNTAVLTLPFFLLLALRFTLHGQFPSTHDVVHDWFNHAQYLLMFVMGALFVQRSDLWEMLAAKRLYFLMAALLSWAALILSYKLREPLTVRIFFVSQQWCAVLAALGYAKQYWNRDHPWRAQLSEAVFPVYIFHQTWIILLTQVFLPLKLKPLLEGPLIILLTFSLSWLSYLIVRRSMWLRPWFGLSSPKPQVPIQMG